MRTGQSASRSVDQWRPAMLVNMITRSRIIVTEVLLLGALLAVAVIALAGVAQAASIRILAYGASNTTGKGVGSEQAWPAVLQRMLRAKGYDAVVTVNAVNGLTSTAILGGVDSAIMPGTQVVIFDVGRANDLKRGVDPTQTQANKEQIAAHIRAHGARPIYAPYRGVPRQPDGIHLSVEGHAQVAAKLVPMVVAAAHR
jgi:acyl-CoA thioesterase-1